MASPSRSRSLADSDSDDYYNRYDSDDFASDDDVVSIKPSSTKKSPPKKNNPYSIPNRGKGRGRGRGRGTSSQNSSFSTPPQANSVAKRMLSASRIRMNECRNKIEELNAQIRDLQEENKTLKKMQFRHQKALVKFEEQESELPQILTKHANEVRTLREQIRKMKEKYNKTDRYLRDAEDELENVRAKCKKYKALAERKDLPERDELFRSLQQNELRLEEKDSRIKDLERHIEALNKNHRHEIGIEIAHHRETKRQLKLLEEKQNYTLESLKEKEKELDIKNIYSNRIMKASPKHLPSSYNGTPHHTPPPGRKKRVPSLTDLTTRDKAKLYEEKRRKDEKVKTESPRHKAKPTSKKLNSSFDEKQSKPENDLFFSSYKKQIETEEDADLWIQREREKIEKEKAEEAKREEAREKERREAAERDLLEREREVRLKEEEQRKRSEERRREEFDREEKERKERIERERKEKEEEEARERKYKREQEMLRMKQEREEREKEEALRKQREIEEQERKAEEERKRLENSPQVQEERRKKDLLLARLKQIDNVEKPSDPVPPDSPVRATYISSNKDTFFNSSRSPGLDSNASTKSNYSFTKPTENLHHGLPSHDDVTVPYLEKQRKIKSMKEDMEVGGYRPSFTSNVFNSDNLKAPTSNKNMISKNNDIRKASVPGNSDRKAKLLNDLFGTKAEDTNSNEDFVFGENTKKGSVTKKSGFPWDDNSAKSMNNSATKRENSSTLFGGGAALIEDEDIFEGNKSKLLPKRNTHSTTTFSSKPAVNAIDHFDDDIEEVML